MCEMTHSNVCHDSFLWMIMTHGRHAWPIVQIKFYFTRLNESFHTYEWVMPHIWLTHSTLLTKSLSHHSHLIFTFTFHIHIHVHMHIHIHISHISHSHLSHLNKPLSHHSHFTFTFTFYIHIHIYVSHSHTNSKAHSHSHLTFTSVTFE